MTVANIVTGTEEKGLLLTKRNQIQNTILQI
jgi:hypothetical protein